MKLIFKIIEKIFLLHKWILLLIKEKGIIESNKNEHGKHADVSVTYNQKQHIIKWRINDLVLDVPVPKNKHSENDSFYYDIANKIRENIKRGGRQEIYEILSQTPVNAGEHILDLGTGSGEAAKYFHDKGLSVTATGIFTESYKSGEGVEGYKQIKTVECCAENISFKDNSFDAVWISHVLEHTMNPGFVLREIHRVLKEKGWLFIIVPPYKSNIVGGHLLTGWNIGQLMYFLLLCNFNVKHGHFIDLKGNVCAFIRKADYRLPKIHNDVGDLEAMTNYWPVPVYQGIEGDIKSINWPPV